MKKRMSRAWAILLCVIISVAYMPMSVFAADEPAGGSINVDISIACEGDPYVFMESTEVTDVNGNGIFDVDDALATIHENYGVTYDNPSGKWITTFWESYSSVGYYINNQMGPNGASEDELSEGDHLYAYALKDTSYYLDDYLYFSDADSTIEIGTTHEYTLMGVNIYSTEPQPYEDAVVGYYDEEYNFTEIGATDENGKVEVKIDEVGTFYLSTLIDADEDAVPAITKINVTEPVIEPAADADVTVSIANAGKFAKAADGSLMIDKAVTVSDINKDGKLDLNEALIAAHDMYNADGKAAYNSYYNDDYESYSVDKLWGVSTYSLGFYKNGAITAAVDQEEVAAGDDIYAFIYADQANWSDVYSAFDKKVAKATVGKPMSLTLSIADWKGSSVYGGATIGIIDPKTGDVTPLKAMTDDNGVAKVTLTKAGTTILTAIPADGGVFTPTACVVTIGKGTQAFKVSTKTKTVSAKKVKKAARTTSAVYVSGVKDKAKKTFYKVSGSKKLTISKTTGKIKVKKGTKKGTYKIKIKVKTAATANYAAGSKTVTVKVRVK